MDKFTNFVSTVKDADVWQQEAATGTSDKLVKCFAVIGLLATAKTVWSPLKRYLTGEKVTAAEAKPEPEARIAEKQRAKNLKERYGGEWAVINEGSDQTTH